MNRNFLTYGSFGALFGFIVAICVWCPVCIFLFFTPLSSETTLADQPSEEFFPAEDEAVFEAPSESSPSSDPLVEPQGEAPLVYAVGDLITISDWSLIVNGVTFPAGDEFNQPGEGMKFVAVDVTIQNIAAETRSVSSAIQMKLKDGTGQQYLIDGAAGILDGSAVPPEGNIASGEQLRGTVGYQVPVEAAGLEFVFEPDSLGSERVFVRLE